MICIFKYFSRENNWSCVYCYNKAEHPTASGHC